MDGTNSISRIQSNRTKEEHSRIQPYRTTCLPGLQSPTRRTRRITLEAFMLPCCNLLHSRAWTMAPAPSTLSVSSAESLLPLLSSSHVLVLDARNNALHQIERIRGSILPQDLHTLSGREIIIYDTGATGLNQHFALAVCLANDIYKACPIGTSVILLSGGLAAVREHAPYLIEAGSYVAKDLPSWARRALDVVREEARPPGQVLPWLYVGAVRHATDTEWLSLRHVTHVLTVCDTPVKRLPNVEYRFIRAKDMPDFPLGACFETCVQFLHSVKETHGTCLVHCTAGASRSVAVVAAYLVWTGLSPKQAMERVRAVRRAADPNPGFLGQLDEWEHRVRTGLEEDDDCCDEEVREEELEEGFHEDEDIPVPLSPVTQREKIERKKTEWALVTYSPSTSLALTSPAVK